MVSCRGKGTFNRVSVGDKSPGTVDFAVGGSLLEHKEGLMIALLPIPRLSAFW